MKNKLIEILKNVFVLISPVLPYFFIFVPVSMFNFSTAKYFCICILTYLISIFLPLIGGIIQLIIWVFSLPFALKEPKNLIFIIYLVLFILYFSNLIYKIFGHKN